MANIINLVNETQHSFTNKAIDYTANGIKKVIKTVNNHGGEIVKAAAKHVSDHAGAYALGTAALGAGYAAKKLFNKKYAKR